MNTKEINREINKVAARIAWQNLKYYFLCMGVAALLFAGIYTAAMDKYIKDSVIQKAMFALFYLLLFLLIFLIFCYMLTRQLIYSMNMLDEHGGRINVWVNHGFVKADRKNYTEWPISGITDIRRCQDSTVLVYRERARSDFYIIVPDIVFTGEKQREDFLSQLRCSGTDMEQPEEYPVFEVSFPVGKEELACFFRHVGAHMRRAGRKQKLSGLLMVIVPAAVLVYLWFRSPQSVLTGLAALISMYVYMSWKYLSIHKYSGLFHRFSFYRPLMGKWRIRVFEHHLQIDMNGLCTWFKWNQLGGIEDMGESYLFFGCSEVGILELPKNVMSTDKMQRMLDYCYQKIETGRMAEKEPQGSKKKQLLSLALLIFAVLLLNRAHHRDDGSWDKSTYDDYGMGDFAFRISDYPDYMSLEKQIEVLEGLGFDIPEGTEESLRQWMEESEYGRIYTEGYPFYSLLMDIGTPIYDEETWEKTGYSSQAYWFDFEGWDISTDYLDILQGVQALSEDFSFTDMKEDDSAVDWENGSGTIRITFSCNGNPYVYDARMEYDWIDAGFLLFLNEVFEQEGCEKSLYICPDNGQGAILFYKDKAWAKRFMEQTKILIYRNSFL